MTPRNDTATRHSTFTLKWEKGCPWNCASSKKCQPIRETLAEKYTYSTTKGRFNCREGGVYLFSQLKVDCWWSQMAHINNRVILNNKTNTLFRKETEDCHNLGCLKSVCKFSIKDVFSKD